MFKLYILVLALLFQSGCLNGQFQSPAGLNMANLMPVVQDLTAALSGDVTALTKLLGVDLAGGGGLADLARILDLPNQYNIGQECLEHTMALTQALQENEDWAMRMVDAFGKPPSGFLQGKFTWLGDFVECRDVTALAYDNATTRTGPKDMFKGLYCNVNYNIDMTDSFGTSTPLSIGVCLPDSCTTTDVVALAALMSNVTGPYMEDNLNFTLPPPSFATCQEDMTLDTRAIVVLCICGLFVFVMVVATLYDVIYVQWLSKRRTTNTSSKSVTLVNAYQNGGFKADLSIHNGSMQHNGVYMSNIDISLPEKLVSNGTIAEPEIVPELQFSKPYEPGRVTKLLLSFSMFTNATKILDTRQPKGALTAINGIRFLSMSWVIVGHSYGFIQPYIENPIPFYSDYATRFLFTPIINGTFSVDSFFVLSGLLLTYLTLKELKKRESPLKFNWGLFYFHRIWRLTPPYMLILMVYVALNKYWANGPLWSPEGMERYDCNKWWTNLLYINNIVDADKMCFGWAWYLANDMQFYVLSPLMIVPLFVFPIVGGLMCLVFLLVSVISSAVISVQYDLPPSVTFVTDVENSHYMSDYYFKPWCRVGPYAIGVFAGYLLYRWNAKVSIPKYMNLLIWLIAGTAGALVVYGLYTEDGTNPLSADMGHAYNATSRSIWGACVAWVIFACATENGGPVNHLLSWPGFVPLARLSYCAYLVHPFLMYTHDTSMRTLLYASDYSMIYLTLGHLCMSYAVAFVASLAFEAPMMGIEKVLLGRSKNS